MTTFEDWLKTSKIEPSAINKRIYSINGKSVNGLYLLRIGFEAGKNSCNVKIRRLKERLTSCRLNAENTITIIGNCDNDEAEK
jgi:hypothetical protein